MRPRVNEEKKARTKGISLKPEAYQKVMRRVAELSPFVKNFSAYFQLLAEIDLRDRVLEKEILRKLQENGMAGLPGQAEEPKARRSRASEGKN